MTTPTCTVPDCDKPVRDSFVCNRHYRWLERDLGDMPALIAELVITETRQGVGALGGGKLYDPEPEPVLIPAHLRGHDPHSALPSTPWQYSPEASVVLDDAANTLGAWCRHLTESRGVCANLPINPPSLAPSAAQVATTAARWLLVHAAAIRLDEAGGQLCDEISYVHRQLTRTVDGRDPGDFIGRCTAMTRTVEDAGVIRVEPCGTDMYAKGDRDTTRCGECEAEYVVADAVADLHERAATLWVTPAEAVAWLARFHEPIKPERIERWRQRGVIATDAYNRVLIGEVLTLSLNADERRARTQYGHGVSA